MHLHRRIATRLEAGYGGRAGEVAAQLAVHFERGGQTPQAIHYWQQVGENAARRHAYPEAIAALRTGLALLATLPDTPERTRHELARQLILGELLMAAHGMASPEAGEAYTRAHALCQHVMETPQHFQVLWGLCQYYRAQAHLRTAEELSQQLFHLGQRLDVPVLVLAGHVALGTVAFYRGNVVAARAHLEASLDLCVTSQPPTPLFSSGYEPGVMHGSWFALVLWLLGYADQAQQRSQGALALAQQIGHPPSQAVAAAYASMFSQCRRDAAATSYSQKTRSHLASGSYA
jgi:adenylate cyclase